MRKSKESTSNKCFALIIHICTVSILSTGPVQ